MSADPLRAAIDRMFVSMRAHLERENYSPSSVAFVAFVLLVLCVLTLLVVGPFVAGVVMVSMLSAIAFQNGEYVLSAVLLVGALFAACLPSWIAKRQRERAARAEQRRSFVRGNTAAANESITRELVDRVADEEVSKP